MMHTSEKNTIHHSIPTEFKEDGIINYLFHLISYDTTQSEVECMQYIETTLVSHISKNISIERQDIGDQGRYNLIIKNTNDPDIILAGHIDVVPVEDQQQFEPYIDGQKLYGRGAVDMKGGVAVIMDILPELMSSDKKVWALFYCDEEYYFKGMKKFTEKFQGAIQPKLVIIPEPTNNNILLSFRGCVECDIEIEGTSAHAARKYEGINAIEEMTRFYTELESFVKQKDSEERGFQSSVNLAYMHGGYRTNTGQLIKRANMVANIAKATFDIRLGNDLSQSQFEFFCKEYFDHREKEIRATGNQGQLKLLTNTIKLRLSPLLQKNLEEKYQQFGDINPGTSFGYSDIQLIKEHIGGDCVQIGPSPNQKCHQKDEYVNIASLYKTKQQIKNLLGL